MYLSRLMLNPDLRKTQIALFNPNVFHGALEAVFKESSDERYLWRIDKVQNHLYLMIVSRTLPDFKSLEEQFGYPQTKAESLNYQTFLDKIQNGGTWKFKITCNPTISLSVASSSDESKSKKQSRGKVVPVCHLDNQIDWLAEKGLKNGFKIDKESVQLIQDKAVSFKKKTSARKVSFQSVTLEGLLTVTDADSFREALISGIGREKAFGQGMMTIVRVST